MTRIIGLAMPDMLEDRLVVFLANHWRANEVDLPFCNKSGKRMVRNKVPAQTAES